MEEQYCTFYLNNSFYGIPVRSIQEIIQNERIKQVPLAGSLVAGLINLRGQIITVLDLRKILNHSSTDSEITSILICFTDHGLLGMLVDEVDDIIYLNPESWEPPPGTLNGNIRELIDSIYKFQNKLLLALNIQKTSDLAYSL